MKENKEKGNKSMGYHHPSFVGIKTNKELEKIDCENSSLFLKNISHISKLGKNDELKFS